MGDRFYAKVQNVPFVNTTCLETVFILYKACPYSKKDLK